MSLRIAAMAASAVLFGASMVHAQDAQKVEWTQQLNVPKGQNMPAGIKADVLGIELGASYAEVRAILEQLLTETRPGAVRVPVNERKMVFDLPIPGTKTQASYIALINADRDMPGTGKNGISETLTVMLSAPSSGHQVLRVVRRVQYIDQTDQPKVSEVVAALKAKFKATPFVQNLGHAERQIFVFNKGAPAKAMACNPSTFSEGTSLSSAPTINADRACDVALWVEFIYGISNDHASVISFNLFDNDRARQDLTADAKFLEGYVDTQVRKLREQTRGQPPKL